VVVYEILPPRIVDGTIESYAERISTLLSQTHIDAINIPEVHAEESRGNRPIEDRLRAEPREFGKLIQDSVGIEAIVNRVTVLGSDKSQSEWFRETHDDYGIENIILVGGESGEINYSGPSVTDASIIIEELNKEYGTEIFCGGISLPSRKVESKKMRRKSNSGIQFFTTQVLYDSDDICKMLEHYHNACKEAGEEAKRVLLSFAPISTAKNIDFLKWLGVKIPEEIEEYLKENVEEIKNRSIEVSMRILEEVLEHITEKEITVPIGLNIEHIMTYNFRHSVELLQTMSKMYRSFCLETKIYKYQKPDN
jgi:5,10-methylenetetrahydrofolate reductase